MFKLQVKKGVNTGFMHIVYYILHEQSKDGKVVRQFNIFQDLVVRGEILEKLGIDCEYKFGYYARVSLGVTGDGEN